MTFEKVKDNVYLLRVPHGETTTAVVLLTGDKNYLVDASGNAGEVDEYVIPALKALSLTLSDIECLFITHTHADHIGGIPRMRENGLRTVAAYTRSVPKISDPLKYNIEIRKAFPENSPPPSSGLSGDRVNVELSDREVVDGRVELIASPGHDDDAVCIYDRATDTLICGDSVQHNGTLVQGCALYMYLGDYRDSMKKLLGVSAETAVLGHPFLPHGDVIDGSEKVREFFFDALAKIDEYERFVKTAYENGERDIAKIAESLVDAIGGVQPSHLFLPMYTVREHIREIENK